MDEIASFARQRIEKGSKSFAMAARLFDADMRASVYMLYAWCRRCDDEIDGQELGFAATGSAPPIAARLAMIEEKTRAALAGEACEPEFVALARVMRQHRIPDWLPFEHLAGFAMDAAATSYRSLDDTLKYCWHVAGAVGVMMAMVMGARGRDVLLRASDLGIAFQLTNIARDVVADARSGRVYLPSDWLAAEALTPGDVGDPQNRAAVHRVTTRLLAEADDYYGSATHGLAALPPRAAVAIGAARSVYRSIGCLVRRRGAAAWDARAIVGPAGKAGAVLSGAGLAAWSRIAASLRPAPERPGLYSPAALDRL